MNKPQDYNTETSQTYELDADQPIAQVTNMADKFLQQSFSKFQFASKALELDKYTEEIGLGPISKQLTMDRMKSILAGYAMYKIVTSIKSMGMKTVLIGGVGFLALKNKEQLMSLFNKDSYISSHLSGEKL